MELAAVALRFVLASVFLVAGLAKLPHRREFTRLVRRYDVVPRSLVVPVGRLLPPVEVALGLCLAVGLAIRPVALIVALILCVFGAVVAINLLRGNEIDCGCFSIAGPSRISWLLVGRNLVLAAAAAVIALHPPGALSLDRHFVGADARGVSSIDALAMLVLGIASAALAVTIAETARTWNLIRRTRGRTV